MILSKDKVESIDLYREIERLISSGQSEKLLIIVPTNRKLRDLKKEIINLSPGQAVSEIHIETLTTLSSKLLEDLTPYVPLSEAASSVFIKECTEKIKLIYFTNYGRSIPDGTLDRIKNVISEYKRHGITPNILIDESSKLSKNEKLKAIDIANIYSAYKEKTSTINAFEIGDIYEKLLNSDLTLVNKSFNKLFGVPELIVLLGFDEFTLPEIKLIDNIANNNSTKLFIEFDYFTYNPLIFSHLEETYKKLERFGFHSVNDKSVYQLTDFTSKVRENLFLKRVKQTDLFTEKLIEIEARTREEEIELIGKKIKDLLLEEKVEPHKICVVFNLISDYSPLIRDVLERLGIPFNLTDRTPLDQSPPVTALVNFLEIAENDFYYKNIFRAFNGMYFEDLQINITNLNYVASELKIVSGLYNWKNSLSNALNNHFGDDQIKEEYLREALKDVQRIEEKLKPFSAKMTPSEFYEKLLRLISDSNLTKSVLKSSEKSREWNIAGLTTFVETLEEILKLLDLQFDENQKFDLEFYLDQIRTACGWARFNVKGRSDYGVLVTSVNEIRGLKFDYLFIAGLNEGIFPTRYNPEIFFSGSFAKKENTHQTEERYHFYQALTCWKKHLYLSSAQTGNERELVRSNFLNDFTELFKHSVLTKESFEKSAYNIEDVQINVGQHFSADMQVKSSKIMSTEDLNKIKTGIHVSNLRSNEPHQKNAYNGYLNFSESEKLKTELEKFGEREYSISQLETYAKCPFKYFMQYVLKMNQISEPTEEVEAIEIGSVLHKILFEFYTEVRKRKIKISSCDQTTFNLLVDLIFDIAERNLNSPIFLTELSFYERERILGIETDRKESVLYKFLEKEREEDSQIEPSYFEVAFGNIYSNVKDEKLSSSEPVELGRLKFKGKIDRVDIDKGSNSFSIVDYKLSPGSKPSLKDIDEGIALQLPLYLFAAKKLFEEKEIELSPGEVYIYSLKYSEKDFGKKDVSLIPKKVDNRDEEMERLLNETVEKIENYVDKIILGEFPLTSLENRENKVCRFCDFRKICRIDDTEL